MKHKGRVVHSDEMKLRTLTEKVKREWLNPIKASIIKRLTQVPISTTYAHILGAFKNKVNKTFLPTSTTTKHTRHHIQQVIYRRLSGQRCGYGRWIGLRRNNFGRGFGTFSGIYNEHQGGIGCGGPSHGRPTRNRPDSKTIINITGEQVKYHP